MKFLKIEFFFLLIFLLTSSICFANTAAKDKKNILVLNSYTKGYKWTDSEVQGIEDQLANDPNVILRIEYMDTKMINNKDHFELLRQLYKNKYSDHKFDVIISTDDDALKFLRQYREELFPGVPVVFCGVNNFTDKKVRGFDNFTGVNEAADFKSNFDLILKLHPKVKKLYVINDNLTTGKSLRTEFFEALKEYEDKFEVESLTDDSMQDLRNEVSLLNKGSVIYYLSFFRDKTGQTYTPIEAIPEIASAAAVPMYGSVDYMLGYGIVGGMLKNSYYQGESAANLAKKILEGFSVDKIPVVLDSPNEYMFDYQQLSRFDINITHLPEGSIIINEPETFYYKYKHYIFTIIGVFVLLVFYIMLLLINIKKRKKAQNGLQRIIETSPTLFDTSSTDSFKEGIVAALNKVLPIDKNYISFKYATDKGDFDEDALVNVDGAEQFKNLPKNAMELIKNSITDQKSVVKKNNSVAYFKGDSIPLNMIYAETDRNLDGIDRDLLELFTAKVSMAVENIEKNKIEESLETARQIQMSMLPTNFVEFTYKNPVDLQAFLTPAKEVGGDLYDFFIRDDNQIVFTVGDVSDKGVPAALFMAVAKTLIRSVSEQYQLPAEILHKVNNELCRNNEQSMFVTLFLAVLDLEKGELHFANAGHNPSYLVGPDGSISQMKVNEGMVLGAFEDVDFVNESIPFGTNQGILLYSDGITEAMDSGNNQYGEDRLESALKEVSNKKADDIIRHVVEDVKSFTAKAPQSDDITALFVRNCKK